MRVQGPNGIVIDFPDGTDEATVGRVMTQAMGGAQTVSPDKYQQAAQDEAAKLKSAGVSDSGMQSMILHGATMGAAPTLLAGLDTPVEMLKHGTLDPSEGWKYAKAKQDAIYKQSQDETGLAGAAADLGGGLLSGLGIANAGGTFVKAGQSLVPRMAAMAGDGAAYGGVNGYFDSGNDLGGALKGAAAGAAIGGALPVVGAVGGAAVAPLVSNIRARINPAGVADSQLARALMESGRDPSAISQEVADAAAGGQGQFTVADALGNAGQRMLSGVTRSPGEGRTQVADFLENRQAGQARSVGNILTEGLGAQKTSAQLADALMAQRTADAGVNYGAARAGAAPVDVAPAIESANAALPAAPVAPKPMSIADTLDAEIQPQQPAPPAPYDTGPANPGSAPKGESLIAFLRKRGGVNDVGGDLKSMGMNVHPGLISRGGMNPDTARELAEQAGYLGHFNQNNLGNTTVSDFLDAVGDHPRYTPDIQAALDAHASDKAAFNTYQDAYKTNRQRILGDLLDTGHSPREIDDGLLDHAAHMATQGEAPWQNAYESAAIRSVDGAPNGAASQAPLAQPAPPSDIGSGIRDNSIESVVRRAKSFLTDGKTNLSDFPRTMQAKREIDNLIEQGTNSQKHALIPIRDALDEQLSQASPAYANARNVFRQQSQAIDAIPQGKAAAMRGRAEDTVPAFNAMPADQQAAFRVGYADPLIEQASNGAVGVNKARPLLGDGPQAELSAMSLHNGPYQPGAKDIMAQRLARENTMFETRNAALGGSKTADNLADQSALEIDPSILGHLLHGNIGGAAMSGLRQIGNGLTGNTPAVRAHLAELLLQRGSSPNLGETLSRVTNDAKAKQALAAALMRGAAMGEGELSGRYLK